MMRYVVITGCILLLMAGCLREKYRGEDCRREVEFVMEDVPYIFVNEEAVGYRPYYTFIERLDLHVFSGQQLKQSFKYGFAYCREHPVIPQTIDDNSSEALFVANLYSPGELSWSYRNGRLEAVFSIIDYEEPPVLLSAIPDLHGNSDSVEVALRMIVSRLEIRVTNPPVWVTGLEVTVRDIAATISTGFILGDTTHINKKIEFDNQGPGTYWFGVNTFPTYRDKSALVSIDLVGVDETSTVLVDDNRLHLLPGAITRLNIEFVTDEKITVSIEINGKWEVIDGGNIII